MIIFMKFVISNHHVRGDFLNANFVGYKKAPAGYYLSRRKIYVFEPLRPLYQATHLLKITAHLLLTYYSISYILRKRKAYTWEVAEARMRLR